MQYKRLEINLESILNNLTYFKGLSSQKMIFIAKSNCYGHGLKQVVDKVKNVVDYFAVINLEDAIYIRRMGIDKPILRMANVKPNDIIKIVDFDITQAILSLEDLAILTNGSKKLGCKINAHLKIDTGMNRQGLLFTGDNYEEILQAFNTKNIVINGLYTHFSCADDKYNQNNLIQYKRFLSVKDYLVKRGIDVGLTHVANTNALINLPYVKERAYRVGIGAYGTVGGETNLPLKAAMRFSSKIVQIKDVINNYVGYGATPVAGVTRIGVVPVGYFDGVMQFTTDFSVKINNAPARVLGKVCMNHLMVDLSNVCCQVGDEAVFFENSYEMYNYAMCQGLSVYQVECLLGQNAKPVYIG